MTTFFNASLSGNNDDKLLVAEISNDFTRKQLQQPQADQKHASHHIDVGFAADVSEECGLIGVDSFNCSIFTPLPGERRTVSAHFGNLTCSLTFTVDTRSPTTCVTSVVLILQQLTQTYRTEKFALVAYDGTAWFLQPLPIEVCAPTCGVFLLFTS